MLRHKSYFCVYIIGANYVRLCWSPCMNMKVACDYCYCYLIGPYQTLVMSQMRVYWRPFLSLLTQTACLLTWGQFRHLWYNNMHVTPAHFTTNVEQKRKDYDTIVLQLLANSKSKSVKRCMSNCGHKKLLIYCTCTGTTNTPDNHQFSCSSDMLYG